MRCGGGAFVRRPPNCVRRTDWKCSCSWEEFFRRRAHTDLRRKASMTALKIQTTQFASPCWWFHMSTAYSLAVALTRRDKGSASHRNVWHACTCSACIAGISGTDVSAKKQSHNHIALYPREARSPSHPAFYLVRLPSRPRLPSSTPALTPYYQPTHPTTATNFKTQPPRPQV